MEFIQAYEKLISSTNFGEWRARNEHSYLVHFFAELDRYLRPSNWEIGYYNKESDLITTFTVNEVITLEPEAEVFKEKDTIEELRIGDVKQSSDAALRAARTFQLKQYPQHPITKGIIILQHIDTLGVVWNITLITQSFAALNIKVDAGTGAVVNHNLATFFDLRAK